MILTYAIVRACTYLDNLNTCAKPRIFDPASVLVLTILVKNNTQHAPNHFVNCRTQLHGHRSASSIVSGLLSILDLCQWHVEWLTPA